MKTRPAVILWLVASALSGCLGPKPVLSDEATKASGNPGAGYTVTALLHNDGPGEGQVEVEAILTAADGGTTYRGTRKVHLEAHERTVVTLSVVAPPGDYRTKLTVEYPPR